MKKLLIEVYAVTDQNVYNDDGHVKTIRILMNQIAENFKYSFMKNKVELKLIDVLHDAYNEELTKENLSQGQLLPWVYFNGELMFYNGISESMIQRQAMKQMKYKIIRKK